MEEEVDILKKMWAKPEISLDDMTKVLKDHTREAIRKKAGTLRLGPRIHKRKMQIDYDYLLSLGTVIEG